MLKTETAKNLQSQLDQQKRRMTNDAQKMHNELIAENENLKKEMALVKNDEVEKEAQLAELKKQCAELLRARSIEVNLLMNQPRDLGPRGALEAHRSAAKGSNGKTSAGMGTKAMKNLQLAKDLNREMELMFADDDFAPNKPKKGRGKKQKGQVGFGQASNAPGNLHIPADLVIQNQIQAA